MSEKLKTMLFQPSKLSYADRTVHLKQLLLDYILVNCVACVFHCRLATKGRHIGTGVSVCRGQRCRAPSLVGRTAHLELLLVGGRVIGNCVPNSFVLECREDEVTSICS